MLLQFVHLKDGTKVYVQFGRWCKCKIFVYSNSIVLDFQAASIICKEYSPNNTSLGRIFYKFSTKFIIYKFRTKF